MSSTQSLPETRCLCPLLLSLLSTSNICHPHTFSCLSALFPCLTIFSYVSSLSFALFCVCVTLTAFAPSVFASDSPRLLLLCVSCCLLSPFYRLVVCHLRFSASHRVSFWYPSSPCVSLHLYFHLFKTATNLPQRRRFLLLISNPCSSSRAVEERQRVKRRDRE